MQNKQIASLLRIHRPRAIRLTRRFAQAEWQELSRPDLPMLGNGQTLVDHNARITSNWYFLSERFDLQWLSRSRFQCSLRASRNSSPHNTTKRKFYTYKIIVLGVWMTVSMNYTLADQFAIEFDYPELYWTGIVDSATDDLAINSWGSGEQNTHGIKIWTPSTLPMVWPAMHWTDTPYDVPDTFATFTFGFVSATHAESLVWNEGRFASPDMAPA